MGCSTPGFPVLHYLPEFAQTHVHRVGDAIQPSHALSSPSPAFSLSQNQSFPVSQFFTPVGQSIGASTSAPVLPMNIQGWFLLGWTGWISLWSKGLSRIFSKNKQKKNLLQHHSLKASIFQCSAFFMVHLSPWLLEKDSQKNSCQTWTLFMWLNLLHLSTEFCGLSLFLMVQESGNSSATAIWKLFIWFQDEF